MCALIVCVSLVYVTYGVLQYYTIIYTTTTTAIAYIVCESHSVRLTLCVVVVYLKNIYFNKSDFYCDAVIYCFEEVISRGVDCEIS